ncbi:MAG: hypothetical protein RR942_09870 [Romboutsia sp.]
MNNHKIKVSIVIIAIILIFILINIIKYNSFKEDVLYTQSKLKSFAQVQKQSLPKIISREKSLKIANNCILHMLNIEDKIELKSIFLENITEDKFIWNISIVNTNNFDIYNMQIDSHTGEIILFQTIANYNIDSSGSYSLSEYELEEIKNDFFYHINIDISNYELIDHKDLNFDNRYKRYDYISKNQSKIITISIDMKTKQIDFYVVFTPELIGDESYENFISRR